MSENLHLQFKKLKVILYDLSRLGEWWLLSLAMVVFAYIPHIYRINGDHISLSLIWNLITTAHIYISITVIYLAQMFLFASNDYFDRNVDALDEKKRQRNPVSAGRVTKKEVQYFLLITLILPLVISLYFDLITFLFTAFAMSVFYYYTAEPLRFKSKPYLDVLSHGVFINTFPYFFCILALRAFAIGAIILLIVIIVRSAIAQMMQEIRDYEIDLKVEKNTVITLGKEKAASVIFALFMTTTIVITAIILIDQLIYDLGISGFYIVFTFICVSYIPMFLKLKDNVNNKEFIESFWMGQGRTSKQLLLKYAVTIGLYFILVFFVLL